MSGNLGQALNLIKDNKRSSEDSEHPVIYFIDDDMIRAPQLRDDYEFPYLH